MVGFSGRCIPVSEFRPSQNGMASRSGRLCDVSSSYLSNLQVYLEKGGQCPEKQQGQGAKVVRDLATPVHGSGRNIITDNFTSHALAKFLLGQNLTLLGTVRKTHKELATEIVLKMLTALELVSSLRLHGGHHTRTPEDKQDRCLAVDHA